MSISRFITKPLARAISKSILGEGSVFDPLSLFANGEEGAWYDPSDLTTLYQDSAGTIPVTADSDPVGLMLDKSKGLVLGGDEFAGYAAPSILDSGGCVGAWDSVTGTLSNSVAGSSNSHPRFSWTMGTRPYWRSVTTKFTGDVSAVFSIGSTVGGLGIVYRATDPTNFSVEQTFLIPPNTVDGSLQVFCDGTSTFSVHLECTVKELPGNHASQATSGLKPLYRTDGTLHWLEFDGFDDWLAIPVAFMGSASDSNTTIAASKSTGGGIYLLGCTSDQGIMMLNGPTGYRGAAYTSGLNLAGASTGLFASGSTVVASSKFDRDAGSVDIQLSTGYSDVTTFTPSDKLIPASSALGIRGTQVISLFQGSFYGIVTNNTAMSEADRASAEAYLATKSGVTL